MGKRALVSIALSSVVIAGMTFIAIRIPESCYTSPSGEKYIGQFFRKFIVGQQEECDPFAKMQSKYPMGPLSFSYSFESNAIPNALELTIAPDGKAELARGLGGATRHPVKLTPADYQFFYKTLAPLRNYSMTRVEGEVEQDTLYNDPSRAEILCRQSHSLAPNSLFISWNSKALDFVEPGKGNFSIFDLGCEGPAGAALRARAKAVADRLDIIDQALEDKDAQPI